jgi:hypothetical protein
VGGSSSSGLWAEKQSLAVLNASLGNGLLLVEQSSVLGPQLPVRGGWPSLPLRRSASRTSRSSFSCSLAFSRSGWPETTMVISISGCLVSSGTDSSCSRRSVLYRCATIDFPATSSPHAKRQRHSSIPRAIPRRWHALYLLAKSASRGGLQNRNARFDSSVPRFSQAPRDRGFWLSGADRGIMFAAEVIHNGPLESARIRSFRSLRRGNSAVSLIAQRAYWRGVRPRRGLLRWVLGLGRLAGTIVSLRPNRPFFDSLIASNRR